MSSIRTTRELNMGSAFACVGAYLLLTLLGLGIVSGTASAAVAFRAASSGSTAGTSSTALFVTKPTGTVSGDVMVAAVTINSTNGNIAAQTGWHLIRDIANTSKIRLATYY